MPEEAHLTLIYLSSQSDCLARHASLSFVKQARLTAATVAIGLGHRRYSEMWFEGNMSR